MRYAKLWVARSSRAGGVTNFWERKRKDVWDLTHLFFILTVPLKLYFTAEKFIKKIADDRIFCVKRHIRESQPLYLKNGKLEAAFGQSRRLLRVIVRSAAPKVSRWRSKPCRNPAPGAWPTLVKKTSAFQISVQERIWRSIEKRKFSPPTINAAKAEKSRQNFFLFFLNRPRPAAFFAGWRFYESA